VRIDERHGHRSEEYSGEEAIAKAAMRANSTPSFFAAGPSAAGT
jgi:hypothetical protein